MTERKSYTEVTAPKSGASANSAIPADKTSIPFLRVFVNLDDTLIGSGALAKRGNLR